MIKIEFLGTGTSVPSLKRVSSSIFVTGGSVKILIDIGPSVLRRLLERKIDPHEIDIIFLTHFHVDHSGDLPAFLFSSNYGIEPRTRPLWIMGGPGIISFLKKLYSIYPWIVPKFYELQVLNILTQSAQFGGIRISSKRVNHNKESVAIRIDGVKSFVFSGDTDYSRNLIDLSSGVDLLIAECSFPTRKVKGHLNLETLKRIVSKCNPKEVIITHLYPEWDNFDFKDLPYKVAFDGMEVTLL